MRTLDLSGRGSGVTKVHGEKLFSMGTAGLIPIAFMHVSFCRQGWSSSLMWGIFTGNFRLVQGNQSRFQFLVYIITVIFHQDQVFKTKNQFNNKEQVILILALLFVLCLEQVSESSSVPFVTVTCICWPTTWETTLLSV